MKITLTMIALTAGLTFSSIGFAQTAAPTGAPVGTSGICKDGSYSASASKKGACANHGGVKDWYATAAGASPAAMNAAPAAPAPAVAAAAASPNKTPNLPAPTAAVGGGAGKVWVNTSSKVYHCSGTKWYGTTKAGSYMTEAAAKAAGNRADHGKACS
ncbi:DUF3761 domain-containing protein [Glaciimonas immobilis]|uniref:DUF3761 domain-containing protein n=1 Tax=Glaciimonas immobilis TaxID=728004 RepID=A0A840RNS2_9BURK|nr:DUF3761 domain-containing protein [Glaciimonas immobilis]KAF3997923.1 DUF3761 domain-containing protein [Glaciimonas immobilis]MBB5199413.1 hypothetical protein [Glaciimonas immobilis]